MDDGRNKKSLESSHIPLTSLGVIAPLEWLDTRPELNTRPPATDCKGFRMHRAMTISRAVFTSSHEMEMAMSEEIAAVQVSRKYMCTHQPQGPRFLTAR